MVFPALFAEQENCYMDYLKKRCWVEISLDRIENNYRQIRKRLPEGCRFMGIMKSNAYGHGAVSVAKRLQKAGADYFGVAFLDEAIELRQNGITKPILILGSTQAEYVPELIENNVTQTVTGPEVAAEYSKAAKKLDKKLRCHLKVDSGMTRLGFRGSERNDGLLSAATDPNLDVEGVFTHFAVSDIYGDGFTKKQFDDFIELCKWLEGAADRKIKIKHCANSGAVINYPWSYLDMVRPGIALYGCFPGSRTGGIELLPAMSFKTRICQIKQAGPGDTVSYGRTWRCEKPTRIAVLSVGYADGFFRLLSNRAHVLIRGKRAPIVGRVCMDLVMADISDIPEACTNDEVLIFGKDEFGEISVEEQADKAQTISYELLCAVSARVPRLYL